MNAREIAPASTSTYPNHPVRRIYSGLGRYFPLPSSATGNLRWHKYVTRTRSVGDCCRRRGITLPNIAAAQSDSRYRSVPKVSCGLARSGDALKLHFPDLVVSKHKVRRADAITCVRQKRQEANQNVGFASRPFVLCELPVRRPQPGQFLHERRNGHLLPWGRIASCRSFWRRSPFGSRIRLSVSQRGGDARYVRHATGRPQREGHRPAEGSRPRDDATR